MNPGKIAKSIGLKEFLGLNWFTSAPFYMSLFTIYIWFFWIAIVSAVYPLGVTTFGSAPFYNTNYTDCKFALNAALINNVCFVSLVIGLLIISGYFLRS
jgi:hypothetical protein